jgi:uncharacterized protein
VIVEKEGFILLNVRVVPRASNSEIVGEHDGSLKVKVSSPPVGGAANSEVVRLLAKSLGLPRSAVTLVSGLTSKTKQMRIDGVTAAEIRKLLGV